jgi:hypothetical protein
VIVIISRIVVTCCNQNINQKQFGSTEFVTRCGFHSFNGSDHLNKCGTVGQPEDAAVVSPARFEKHKSLELNKGEIHGTFVCLWNMLSTIQASAAHKSIVLLILHDIFFWQYPLKQILALMHNNNVKVGHGGHFIAYYAWRTAMLQTEPRTSIQKQFTFVPIQDTMSTHVCRFFPIITGHICTAMFSK